jgi:hypothetical protein
MNIKGSVYTGVIIVLLLGIAITLHATFIPPLTLEQEIDAVLIQKNPKFKEYPHTLTIDKQSGNYLRFHVTPKPGVELDPAFGFAEKQHGQWTILNIGTGGDPTVFYNEYNIPEDLRDDAIQTDLTSP